MPTILIAAVPVGIFVLVMFIWVKNGNKDMRSMIDELSDAQVSDLKNNDVQGFDNSKNTWTQKAMISRVTEKGNIVHLKVLWFNTVIQGHNSTGDFQYADIKMKKAEFYGKNLQKHSVVTMFIDPNKGGKIL